MLAAGAFTPHEAGGVDGSLDIKPWGVSRGSSPHAMKLLDLENVRSLILRNLDVCRKEPPTLHGGQASPRVPETDIEGHYTHADASDVSRLLNLDIEELLQHTYRVQRKRHATSNVSHATSDCEQYADKYCYLSIGV